MSRFGAARERLTLVISRSNKEQETCETTSFRIAANVLSYRDFFLLGPSFHAHVAYSES